MRRHIQATLVVGLLLAFLASSVEAAHHRCEHRGDGRHSPDNCSVCALACQAAITTDAVGPEMATAAMGFAAATEPPALSAPSHRPPFWPRSPPARDLV